MSEIPAFLIVMSSLTLKHYYLRGLFFVTREVITDSKALSVFVVKCMCMCLWIDRAPFLHDCLHFHFFVKLCECEITLNF